MIEVNTTIVNGKRCIKVNAFTYINIKYHKPYLAVLSPEGEPIWQDKEYVGYGKNAEVYYSVENLKKMDVIKAAGGSGSNKYPFTGIVVDIDDKTIKVESIDYKDFNNMVAKRKKMAKRNPEIYRIKQVAEVSMKDLKNMFSDNMVGLILTASKKVFKTDNGHLEFLLEMDMLDDLANLLDAQYLENAEDGVKYIKDSGADYLFIRSE